MSVVKIRGLRAALRTAARVVHMPTRFGRDWVVSGPYDDTNLNGARTEIKRSWYSAALEARKMWVAHLTLSMLGYDSDEIECDLLGFGAHAGATSAREIVIAWIAQREQRLARRRADAAFFGRLQD